ncbi:hypothetical protein [Plantactinospora sp. BC1]|uniref:hypothetical protein n=1 Tax=Plantactinospora sp. BC1 TaxID=2108470 RepID=UPI001F289476|nr:hypothetical protein [Plantactinospora sp. BC1]
MPILWALANPKIGEREVLAAMLEVVAGVVAEHDRILPITEKGFASRPFERLLVEQESATPRHPPSPPNVRQGRLRHP